MGTLESASETPETQSLLWGARLLTHLRKPENLIVYLMVSAWAKFMGVSEFIPTITIG